MSAQCPGILIYIVFIVMFILGSSVGIGAYLSHLGGAPISFRRVVGTAIVHGTSSITASLIIIIAMWAIKGDVEITAPILMAMVGASVLIAKIGNDKLTWFTLRLISKVTGIESIQSEREKILAKYPSLSNDDIADAVEDFITKKTEIENYLRLQEQRQHDDDSELNSLRKLMTKGELSADELEKLRKKKNEGRAGNV